jgi:hypothetical protein
MCRALQSWWLDDNPSFHQISLSDWQITELGNTECKFNQVLYESVYDSLRNVLGEGAIKTLFPDLHLDRYVDDLEELHNHLHYILSSGAIPLETVIVKELFSRLGLPYSTPGNFEFMKSINQARELFIEKQRIFSPIK